MTGIIKPDGSTTYNKLDDAIKHVEKYAAEAQSKGSQFVQAFTELTGYQPNQQITALDVYKIFNRLTSNA